MRRHDKEITDKALMESIIRSSKVCRVALCDGDRPYVVPMCFGYDGRHIYLHGAAEGRKIDILRRNPHVCIEFEQDSDVLPADKPCSFSMRFRSVICTGKASFVADVESRHQALQTILGQYTRETFILPDNSLEKIALIRVEPEEMTGKQSRW
ncbi:MAG TPA: pyridoxamine 5'-phosphate oxidase family protein [Deltaproteobacteria bacterium]|nr:pyridoxamine 5'-phosphate oxidase family protein [Deltaproteobacteria bacterium]HPR55166.1 pyridoxamine 5'-phosphate oxidase family protein [Deltaproteobacteria bacterium]